MTNLVFGYAGKPYDPVTGLSDYGFRDYAPSLARFTTVDPIRDGSNWYVYCNADPVNYVDTWGLTASDKGGNDESNTFGKIFEDFGSIAKDILGIAAIGMGKALEWSAPFLGGLAAVGANYGTGGAALAYSSSIAAAVTVATKSLGAALAEQGEIILANGNSNYASGNNTKSINSQDGTETWNNESYDSEKGHREKTRNANANDRKQVDSVAGKFKIDRRKFGDFIEQTKQEMGRGASDNFSYSVMANLQSFLS